jgi:hypothetical protein
MLLPEMLAMTIADEQAALADLDQEMLRLAWQAQERFDTSSKRTTSPPVQTTEHDCDALASAAHE